MLTPITVKARTLGTAIVVTLPKTFRDRLGIRAGHQVTWALTKGVLELHPPPKRPLKRRVKEAR